LLRFFKLNVFFPEKLEHNCLIETHNLRLGRRTFLQLLLQIAYSNLVKGLILFQLLGTKSPILYITKGFGLIEDPLFQVRVEDTTECLAAWLCAYKGPHNSSLFNSLAFC